MAFVLLGSTMGNHFSHNISGVIGRDDRATRAFVDGQPCILAPERILLDVRFSLSMRLCAIWVWGQSINWVFRVEDIQGRLGLTRRMWRTLAEEMKASGFMEQSKEPDLAGGVIPVHRLVFNFTIFNDAGPYPQGDPSREGPKTAT